MAYETEPEELKRQYESIGAAIENAARDLPQYYRIEISVEAGSATVLLIDCDEVYHVDFFSENLAEQVTEATKLAIQHSLGE